MSRRAVLLALAAGAVALANVHLSSAAFTAAPVSAGATIQVDRLSNSFSVTPGSAVQPGTTTAVASGDVDTLSLASRSATAAAGGRIHLSWASSSTTTNLAGYAVYRASGAGSHTRLNGTLATGTSYDDTATVDGTAYTYKVVAVSSDAQPLASLD